jgi:threonine dehydrogenase-like Zn-dependent dehydrogenase
MPAQMLRVLVARPGSLAVESVPVPEPAPGEVRIQVVAAGICGSDLELLDGQRPARFTRYPVQPGHEWTGLVERLGAGVDGPPPGTPVVATGIRGCRACDRCLAGETTLCETGYAETGFTEPGAFAAYLTVPAHLLHVLPVAADPQAAALLEPAACVAGAVLGPVARLRPGLRVAVVGTGTLALLAVQLLAAASPRELVIVGPATGLDHGRKLGATAGVAVDAADADEVADVGADLVVEASADPSAHRWALAAARPGGTVLLGGVPAAPAPGYVDDLTDIVLRSLTVRGYAGADPAAWRQVIALYGQGVLNLSAVVSHRLPLADAGQAFDLLRAHPPGVRKILLIP